MHPALKAWSQGAVGDKSFRQISEEFAEIVIARVWEREGRKVSRVATRLVDFAEESAAYSGAGGTAEAARVGLGHVHSSASLMRDKDMIRDMLYVLVNHRENRRTRGI